MLARHCAERWRRTVSTTERFPAPAPPARRSSGNNGGPRRCLTGSNLERNASMGANSKVTVGLFVRLVAKEGKERAVEDFLRSGLELAQAESGTLQWYAVRFDQRTFAIFDTFATEEGRQAHLSGRIAAALMAKAADLLAEPPRIERHDILAAKT